jgi:Pyruvate/2-oxoacid:ferredoxin oxidoreductase delta subunit
VSKWDVSDINQWKSDQFPRGAVIPEGGNSNDYVTGGWRSDRPDRNDEKCTQCLLCWVFCPDTSVMVKDQRSTTSTSSTARAAAYAPRNAPWTPSTWCPRAANSRG